MNAIEFELESIVTSLKSIHLVKVDSLPKYTSTLVDFKDYQDFRANLDIQSLRICKSVDLILRDEIDDESYKFFRKRLLGSKTMYVYYVLFIIHVHAINATGPVWLILFFINKLII